MPRVLSVVSGDTIQFRGDNNTYADGDPEEYIAYTSFSEGTSANFLLLGNIMSLINSTNFNKITTLEENSTFLGMFMNCEGLSDASELLLPATTLAKDCYNSMFLSCISLTTAPELPATTLTPRCYCQMFSGCESLTTAPELPATTLAERCYGDMFTDCTSLTTAPALPATTLTQSCYEYMFLGCKFLNYIVCLATDISAQNCTYCWLIDVASTGTFVKNPNMQSSTWGTGNSGIPNNWTVVDAQ